MAKTDFNGDGRDDILWRNTNGILSNWLGTESGGFTVNAVNAFLQVPTSWAVFGTGDFNGDGRDDILWWNTNSGQVSNWLGTVTGGFINNDAHALMNLPGFQNAGGDFNGDGRDDILWRDTLGGDIGYWKSNAGGDFELVGPMGAKASTDWEIAEFGDFNGDGSDDILWRNDNGALSNWLGSPAGFTVNDANAFRYVPNNWRIVGTGDYNGDGRDDILWRNSDNGALSNWLGQANGGFVANDAHAFSVVPKSWVVQPNPSGAGEWDYF